MLRRVKRSKNSSRNPFFRRKWVPGYLLEPLVPSQTTAPAIASARKMIVDTEIIPVERGTPALGIGVDVTGALVGVVVAVEVGQ